jgi:hypothetical protein
MCRCAILVVRLRGCVVVLQVIAKHSPAVVQPAAIANQDIPVVMPDFMAEMTEERTIRLFHFGSAALALRVVSLLQWKS